jgi:hypothetical protein
MGCSNLGLTWLWSFALGLPENSMASHFTLQQLALLV